MSAGPVYAYPRDAVDGFVAEAEVERRRLVARIAEAYERTRRARAHVGMQRVMVSMLLETQRELAEQRAAAEREAAAILAAAEQQAQEIVERARMHAPPPSPARPTPKPDTGPAPEWISTRFDDQTGMIDLPWEESAYSRTTPADPETTDNFFSYLRGALLDEEPLGPRFA